MTFGSGGRDDDDDVDLVDDVDAVDAVDSFLNTVGDGGRNVLDVSSDATLLPEMERLLP